MTTLTQVKLLRVLHERAIQRVGGNETIPIDVRILAATHRDLERAMDEQNFREDLFYRLNGVTLTLPPLRERAEDIPQLVEYFTRRYAAEFALPELSIAPEAMCVFMEQEWPGNIRELENAVRKAVLGARGYGLSAEQVREACNPRRGRASAARQPFANFVAEQLAAAIRGERNDVYADVVEAAERELLGQAIKLASGNQARAARWLGLSRLTLREKLHHFGLHPAQEAGRQTRDA
jgi:DNA-binding NtrC family response regulator